MFGGGDHWLIGQLQFLITLVLSLTVHEWAHAWSALKLGDDTASRLGRATLDPFVHIDPIGTFALPLLGVPFGWAKPVPINPGRFRKDVSLRSGLLLTAAAGPASNMCIAIGATLCMALISRIAPDLISGPRGYRPIFEQVIVLNVLLAFFNLLPVPPLDGSRILDTIVPDRLRAAWDQLAAYSPVALVVLLVVPPLVNVPVYDLPRRWASSLISVLVPVDGGDSNGPSMADRREWQWHDDGRCSWRSHGVSWRRAEPRAGEHVAVTFERREMLGPERR